MLFARGVSGRLSTTVATRHGNRGPGAPNASVPPVALLAPGVGVVVVAQGLPEAWLVLVHEPEAAHPLGALPEVQVGDQQAGRAAVLGFQGLAIVLVGNPGPAARHVIEGEVRGVAAVAEREDVARGRLDAFEQGIYRDAPPGGAELRPLGYAVDGGRDGLGGQRQELLPRPPPRPDRKSPRLNSSHANISHADFCLKQV